MKKENRIKEEIEKTLKTIEELERIEGNPYLYTRLQGKLKVSIQPASNPSWFWAPKVQWGTLVILFSLNIFVIEDQLGNESKDDLIEIVKAEYGFRNIDSTDFKAQK